MTAAIIALAVALAAAVGGLIALGLKLADAERRCGDARSDEAGMAVRLESMTAQRDDAERRVDDEKERANALDDLLADYAATGPVAGAYERLLQTWRARRARGDGDGAVSASPAAALAESNDLLRPGE